MALKKLILSTTLLFVPALAGAQTPQQAAPPSLASQWLSGEVRPPELPVTYAGPPITIRFSSFLGPQTPVSAVALKAFERLKEESKGKLVVQPYWSNTLADAQEGGYDAVASGVAQLGTCYSYLNPGGFTLEHGLEMPFLFPTSTIGARALMDVYPQYLRKTFEDHGVYFARGTMTPPQQILSRAAPVRTLEDLKGKKILGVGEVPSAMARALGAAPVPVAPAELYIAFQSGVVDLMVIHDAGAATFKLNELAKYHTDANLSAHALEFCLNKAFFDGLPKDLKPIFYRWLQLWNQAESEVYFDTFAERGRESMKKNGTEFIVLSEAERQKWKQAVAPAKAAWIKQMNAKGEQADKFFDDFAAAVAKYEAKSNNENFRDLMTRPVPGMISGYGAAAN